MEANQPVPELKPDILYQLRPSHPVINAVQLTGKTLLLLIQVSISTYSRQKSKAERLKWNITGCERTYERCNWLEYYCNRLPSTCKTGPIDLFLSPKELLHVADENPAELLQGSGARSDTASFFLGLITDRTRCAEFIQDEYDKVHFSSE